MEKQHENMRYIYFGTSAFAATILEKLLDVNMVPVAVVTQLDRPAGRGGKLQQPPLKIVAEKHGIPLFHPQKIADCRLQIADLHPTVCIIASYGSIIPKTILEIPQHGFINVHPSLLPKYRGPSPIQTALLNGDKETGVSIMLIDEEIDHGPILINHESRIMNHATTIELTQQLALLGAVLLIESIPAWIAGKIKPVPQDHAKATFTKMITKEDGHIDWKKSAQEIERHVRAMTPWPGSWTMWEQKSKKMLLHLKKVSVVKESPPCLPAGRDLGSDNNASSGKIIDLSGDAMLVVCGKDMLAVHTLQPEGKKEMPARAFVNGHSRIIESILT